MNFEFSPLAIRVTNTTPLVGPPRCLEDVLRLIQQEQDQSRLAALATTLNQLSIQIGIFKETDPSVVLNQIDKIRGRLILLVAGVDEQFVKALLGHDLWTLTQVRDYALHRLHPLGWLCNIEPEGWARQYEWE